MSSVRTLAQFDRAVNQYLANTWPSEKFDNELGCSNADSAVIRYQRTWVCGQLTSDTGAQGCWGAEREFSERKAAAGGVGLASAAASTTSAG